jgi:hypothetical protein
MTRMRFSAHTVWGDAGVLPMPPRPDAALAAPFATAAKELVSTAASGESHAVDLVFGTRIVELIADAQAQLSE